MLTEENAGVILSYLIIYENLLDKEQIYSNLAIIPHKYDYMTAHSKYESALGHLLNMINPMEVIEILAKIEHLCKSAGQNIKDELHI